MLIAPNTQTHSQDFYWSYCNLSCDIIFYFFNNSDNNNNFIYIAFFKLQSALQRLKNKEFTFYLKLNTVDIVKSELLIAKTKKQ